MGVDPGLIEEHGAVSRRGRQGARRRRDRALRGRRRHRLDRGRRPGRRQRGQAGRNRLLQRRARERRAHRPPRPAARRTRGRPRPIDDRRAAPAAPAAAGARRHRAVSDGDAPRGERLRLFVACELPDAERRALATWGKAAAAGDRALRALPEASLHVTMHFIGWQPEAQAEALAAALREGAAARFVADRAAAGRARCGWPRAARTCSRARSRTNPGRWASFRPASRSRSRRPRPDWRPEQRAFRPHITVARVRRGERPRPGARASAALGRLQRGRADADALPPEPVRRALRGARARRLPGAVAPLRVFG